MALDEFLWVWAGPLLQIVAGSFMLVVAVAVYAIRLDDRLNQALALFLFVRGNMNIMGGLHSVIGPTWRYAEIAGYLSAPITFSLLYFAYVYRVRAGLQARWPAYPWLLLAGAVGLLSYMLARISRLSRVEFGFLFPIHQSVFYLIYAAMGWLLIRDAMRAPTGPRRTSLLLVGVGFALLPSFVAFYNVTVWAYVLLDLVLPIPGVNPDLSFVSPEVFDFNVAGLIFALSIVFPILSARRLTEALREHGTDAGSLRRARFWILFPTAACVLPLIVQFHTGFPTAFGVPFNFLHFSDSVWTFAFPTLVTLAVLKYQVFGLEWKVKVTLSRGALAGVFLATFLVLTQVAEVWANRMVGGYGWAVGAIGAGLLLFALHPLQSVMNRFADRALPGVKSVPAMTLRERTRLYEEWLEIAWRDGQLSAKERELLETARERLGVGTDEASRLERAALARFAGARSRSTGT